MHNEVLEDLIVVKRSGQRVAFNASKVAIAVKKAFESTNNIDDKRIFMIFEKVLSYININYKERKTINVEDIQDIIEKILQEEKCFDVYNSFKDYREKRALSRKLFAEKQQHKFVKAIEKFENVPLNSDYNTSAEQLIYDFGKIIFSEYAKSYILDSKSNKAFEEGNIYIHDVDYFSLGIVPAFHFKYQEKYLDNLKIDAFISKIIKCQKEVHDEIQIDDIDEILIPYLFKKYKSDIIDNLDMYFELFGISEYINCKKINEQIMKEKSININILDYSNYLLNDNVKNIFKKSLVNAYNNLIKYTKSALLKLFINISDNDKKNIKYSISFGKNKSEIGLIISSTLVDIIKEQKFNNIYFIYSLQNGDDNESLVILELLKTNNTIFIENTDKDEHYFTSGMRIYENINNSESFSGGRMIIASTSINFARMGLKYKNKDINDFYKELDNVLEVTKNELLLSFETIGNKSKEYYNGLFIGNVFDDEKLENGQKIRKVIKNGLLNIGFVGLKECAICLFETLDKQIIFINKVINHLNKKCLEYSNNYKINFALFETTCIKARTSLLQVDKAIYGNVNKITDKKMYDLIDDKYINDYKLLSKMQEEISGGKILNVFLNKDPSIKKISGLIDTIKKNNIKFVKIMVNKDDS